MERFSKRWAVLVGMCVAGLWHCGDGGGPSPLQPGSGSGSIAVRLEALPAVGVAKVAVIQGRLRVDGDDMAPRDTLLQVFEGRLVGQLDQISPGQRRVVMVLDGADDSQLWRGETTVQVKKGAVATATLALERLDDTPPAVRLVGVPAAVHIDSSLSVEIEVDDRHDGAGDLEVRWDFDGDGAFDTEWGAVTGPVHTYPAHIYRDRGNYGLRVQVRDGGGQTAEAEQQVLATETIQIELPDGVEMSMGWVGPGTFLMGAPAAEADQDPDEAPQHEVEISRGFYLGHFEVTQEQWFSVMGTDPWRGSGWTVKDPLGPAANVSWEQVQEFIVKLNELAGAELYRLPTEAEWEYAARAGTQTAFHFADDPTELRRYAWFDDNTCAASSRECQTHRVGRLLPNPWGFYDMYGNVWEWTGDVHDSAYYLDSPRIDPQGPDEGEQRVQRGGGFFEEARRLRSANRGWRFQDGADFDIGFRLVRQEL